MSEWGSAETTYRAQQAQARQQIAGPNDIPGLTSPAQHLSQIALFTSHKEKLTQHSEAAPQVN